MSVKPQNAPPQQIFEETAKVPEIRRNRGGRPKTARGARPIVITIRLYPEEREAIQRAADAHSTTVSAWLREAGQRDQKSTPP